MKETGKGAMTPITTNANRRPADHSVDRHGWADHRTPSSRTTIGRRTRTTVLGVLTLMLIAVALGACSSEPTEDSAREPDVAGAPPVVDEGMSVSELDSAESAPMPQDRAGAPPAKAAATPVEVTEPKIVRTAAVAMTVEDIGPAATLVRTAITGLGGHVTDEAVNTTDLPPSALPEDTAVRPGPVPGYANYGRITFAVPADRLDEAIEAVSTHGTVIQRTTSSQDVTATYVDTETRIATRKASIERIRALMARTETIGEIVQLEAQLADREADLESLQAQLRWLEGQVSMSSLTVVLATDPEQIPDPDEDSGFLSGLRAGWTALTDSLVVLLTVIGAVVPWLVLGLLLGWPAWRAWRSRRRRATNQPTQEPDEQP